MTSSGMSAGAEAVQAALQLYDLCQPRPDATIDAKALEGVLRQHVGRAADVAAVMRSMAGDGVAIPTRFDFLSYWQGIDRWFAQASRASISGSGPDILSGLRRFRDGILALWRLQGSQGDLKSKAILNLLREILAGADDTKYWQEVMQSIPTEGMLSVVEVGEAVCTWLREFLGVPHSDASAKSPSKDSAWTSSPTSAEGGRVSGTADRRRSSREKLRPRLDSTSPEPESKAPRGSSRRRVSDSICRVFSEAGGDSGDGGSLSLDLQRVSELVDFIMRPGSRDSETANSARTRLQGLLERLSSAFHRLEDKVNDLESTNELLMEKKDHMEVELYQLQDLGEETHKAQAERDEALKLVALLEQEVLELKQLYASASRELAQLKARTADAERSKMDTQRRDLQWRDRMEQLEQQAENAEGQAAHLRHEMVRTKTQLLEAESYKDKAHRLGEELEDAKEALRSHAGAADEDRECAELLRQQLVAATAASVQLREQLAAATAASVLAAATAASVPAAASGTGSETRRRPSGFALSVARKSIDLGPTSSLDKLADVMRLEKQVQSQQAELLRLRAARDTLLNAHDDCEDESRADDDTSPSPEDTKVQFRLRFQKQQVQALYAHCHELEVLLDSTRDDELCPASCPDSKRRLSIKNVEEEGLAVFNEMSEQLYTLQVQKADADQELRRLATRVQEQDAQLKSLSRQRDELLSKVGGRGGQDAVKSYDLSAADTVTSETRSCSSATTPVTLRPVIGADFLSGAGGRLIQPKVQEAAQAFLSAGSPGRIARSRGAAVADNTRAQLSEDRNPREKNQPRAPRASQQSGLDLALRPKATANAGIAPQGDRKRQGKASERTDAVADQCNTQ